MALKRQQYPARDKLIVGNTTMVMAFMTRFASLGMAKRFALKMIVAVAMHSLLPACGGQLLQCLGHGFNCDDLTLQQQYRLTLQGLFAQQSFHEKNVDDDQYRSRLRLPSALRYRQPRGHQPAGRRSRL
jgi:hypothetical protein